MSLYLALDVGGTKTAALLADGQKVLARAVSGTIKTLRVSPSEAALNLRSLIESLETQLGRPVRGSIARTCIGTSGASAPVVRGWMQAAFAEAVGGDILLLGDEVIALDAAFHGQRGILVIAGTGSNIVGRSHTGAMAHTGGWGPALADEGSGHWIGTEALRACFRAIDAAAPSAADAVSADGSPGTAAAEDLPPLLRRAMQALQLATLDDMIGTANAPGFRSSVLVPVVVEAARAGDSLANEVLLRAGHDLATLVAAVAGKVEALESRVALQFAQPFTPPEVAFVGGVLSNINEVRSAMHAALQARFPGIVLQQSPVHPLEGALWHARGRPSPDV